MQVRLKIGKLARKPFHKFRYKNFKTLNLGSENSNLKNINKKN